MLTSQIVQTAIATSGFAAAATAAIHAVLYKRRPQSAFGWIAVCFSLPFAGALLYYLFGINRVRMRARKLLHRLPEPLCPTEFLGAPPPVLAPLSRLGEAVTGWPLTAGNRVDVLYDAGDTFNAMIAAIDSARGYVYFATYIFDGGPVGKRFASALCRSRRPRRGCTGPAGRRRRAVLVAASSPPATWHRREARAVPAATTPSSVSQRQPTQPPQEPHRRRRRGVHRWPQHSRPLPGRTGRTQDRGPALPRGGTGRRADRDRVPARLAVRDPRPAELPGPPSLPAGATLCRAVTDGPDTDLDRLTALYIGAIGQARRRIAIMTPYFVPPRELITPLQAAALEGVDVAVILPAQNNLWFIHAATRHMLWELLDRGVNVLLPAGAVRAQQAVLRGRSLRAARLRQSRRAQPAAELRNEPRNLRSRCRRRSSPNTSRTFAPGHTPSRWPTSTVGRSARRCSTAAHGCSHPIFNRHSRRTRRQREDRHPEGNQRQREPRRAHAGWCHGAAGSRPRDRRRARRRAWAAASQTPSTLRRAQCSARPTMRGTRTSSSRSRSRSRANTGNCAARSYSRISTLPAYPLALTSALLDSGTTAIAYETVEDSNGRLPLLAPMSAIAGSMAPLMGAYYLAKFAGGRGTLLGTVLGASHGEVAIIGDGVVGQHACDVASALGARVTVFGITPQRAAEFERRPNVRYALSTPASIAARLREADLVVGAVLRVGARAPHVVTEAMVAAMPRGSVIVDVSIDQGGCVATSRPTSHSAPVFVAHGVTHYCVTNMPGAYPRTATLALTAATLPYVLRARERRSRSRGHRARIREGREYACGPYPLRGRSRRAPPRARLRALAGQELRRFGGSGANAADAVRLRAIVTFVRRG